MMNAMNLLDNGFACLIDKLGIVDAERFIALIKRDDFDYTVWQRENFDKMKPGQILEEALDYEKNHPYHGNAAVI